jgi:hypothetical protein
MWLKSRDDTGYSGRDTEESYPGNHLLVVKYPLPFIPTLWGQQRKCVTVYKVHPGR